MKYVITIILVIAASVGVTLFVTKDDNSTNNSTSQNGSSVSDSSSSSGKKLDYSNKGLTEFPKDVLNQTDTVELDLSGNNLDGALPGEIRFLTKLEVLNVSDNRMTGIPAEIGQLSKLRILNYAGNQITGLPNELGNLNNLETFDLSGNNPAQQDLDKIKSDLPNSTQIIL